MAIYNCPACGNAQQLPDQLEGTACNCSSCGNTFIPKAPEAGLIQLPGVRNSGLSRRKSRSRSKHKNGPLLVIAMAFVGMAVIAILVVKSSREGSSLFSYDFSFGTPNSGMEHEDAMAALEDLGAVIRPFPLGLGLNVDLSDTSITDNGLISLQGLKREFGLWLHLVNTQITNAGLRHLRDLRRLEILHLENTKVTDAGLIHLSGLSSLRTLNLSKTRINGAGLKHLSGLRKLRSLNLAGTQITIAGLKNIRELSALSSLDLRETKVTKADLQQIKWEGTHGLRVSVDGEYFSVHLSGKSP
jgi:uncharacterized protein YjbI with pentapeptide repeats